MQRHPSLVILLVTLHVWAGAGQPCAKSGYCSNKDATQFFIGDVAPSENLHNALSAISYRQEIIISVFSPRYMDQLLQLQKNLAKLGYSHFLPIAAEEDHCIVYEAEIIKSRNPGDAQSPRASCVWDTSAIHARAFPRETQLWHLRWRFVARASRLGYNILSMDSDMVVYDDPYQYLKQPPFASFRFMCAWEGPCACNGGWVYVQNAAPNGPTTWIFKQVTDTPLRWQDDDFAFLFTQGKQRDITLSGMCLSFDQSFVADALQSALTHQVINPAALDNCRADPPPPSAAYIKGPGAAPYNPSTSAIIKKSWKLINCTRRVVKQQFPAPMLWGDLSKVVDDGMGSITTGYVANITVPVLADDNNELLSRFYPTVRGNYSLTFLQQLKDDCPNCPWWPGFEDDLTALQAHISGTSAVPVIGSRTTNPALTQLDFREMFAMPPSWLVTSVIRARHGLLAPRDAFTLPRQVFAHIHVTGSHGTMSKIALRKVIGGFDPSLQAQRPFLAGRRPDRLLMLSPSIDLSLTRNATEYSRIVAGLVQVALASGRTVVYPDLPCNTSWLHTRPNAATFCEVPMQPTHNAVPWSDFTVLPQPLQPATASPIRLTTRADKSDVAKMKLALPWTWTPECMSLPVMGAMIEAEMFHWLDMGGGFLVPVGVAPPAKQVNFAAVLLPGQNVQPPAAAAGAAAGAAGAAGADWSPADAIVVLQSEQVVSELYKVADVQVVYLGTPVQMTGALSPQPGPNVHAQLTLQMAKSCKALHGGQELHNNRLAGLFGGLRGSVVDGFVVADTPRVWEL